MPGFVEGRHFMYTILFNSFYYVYALYMLDVIRNGTLISKTRC